MKKLSYILFLITSFLFSQGDFSELNIPDCQILFLDDTGIKETNSAIYEWENQALQKFDAVQSDALLSPIPSYETWAGYVTVANENERRFLSVPDYREDMNFSEGMTVFYVGKSKDLTLLTQLVGTMKGTRFTDPDTGALTTNWTGWRLSISAINQIKAEFGTAEDGKVSLKGGEHDVNRPIALSLQYSDKNIEMHQGSLDQVFSRTLANDYVKNDVPLLLSGQYGTNSDFVSVTANYEIASVIVFNRDLDSSEHNQVWDWLRNKYPDAFDKGFGLEEGFVGDRNLSHDAAIEISFNQPLSEDTGFPNVYKNSLNENPVAGTWEISEANKIRFSPSEQFQKGSMIVVDLFEAVSSSEGDLFENTKERYVSNIIETVENYDSEYSLIATIKTVQQQAGIDHEIPLEISIPKSKDSNVSLEPTPVVFWVHGGAWTGGTLEESSPAQGTFSNYLVQNVGVAVVGVAYRCKGSLGNFTQAMEDVESAVQWVRDNAAEYNIDVNKMGFAGGSAGGPLSALQAQRTPEALLYVGFNGVFDFTLDDNSSFGGGDNYGQRSPTEASNSAAKNIRENPPYTLLLHGREDTTIDPLQSEKFAEAIVAEGGTADVKIYDGEVHSFFSSGQMNIPCTWEFKEACEKAFAQKTEDNLIIKSIYNQSSFKSVNNNEYYFTIVEFEVLNSSINLNNYSLRYDKGDGTNETNRAIVNFNAKIVDSYNEGDPVIIDSDGILNVGDSFYCVEMGKIGGSGTFSLTNLNLYNIIAEYFDFSEADMIDKKHFTNATVSTENFDMTIHNNSSKITLREKKSSGNFSIIDVWEGGLAENNSTIRTTLTPTTTYTPSQWGATLAVNNNYNDFENETIQNPVSSGDVLTFQSMTQKEIRLYASTGELLDVKHNILDVYTVPNGLIGGVYFIRIRYDNAREKTQKLVVN